jgi:hypothetical protein
MSVRNIRDGMASLVHLWGELGAMKAADLGTSGERTG